MAALNVGIPEIARIYFTAEESVSASNTMSEMASLISDVTLNAATGTLTLTAANVGKETFTLSDAEIDYAGIKQRSIVEFDSSETYYEGGSVWVVIDPLTPNVANDNIRIEAKMVDGEFGATMVNLINAIKAEIESKPAVLVIEPPTENNRFVAEMAMSVGSPATFTVRISRTVGENTETLFDDVINANIPAAYYPFSTYLQVLNDESLDQFTVAIDETGNLVFTTVETGPGILIEVTNYSLTTNTAAWFNDPGVPLQATGSGPLAGLIGDASFDDDNNEITLTAADPKVEMFTISDAQMSYQGEYEKHKAYWIDDNDYYYVGGKVGMSLNGFDFETEMQTTAFDPLSLHFAFGGDPVPTAATVINPATSYFVLKLDGVAYTYSGTSLTDPYDYFLGGLDNKQTIPDTVDTFGKLVDYIEQLPNIASVALSADGWLTITPEIGIEMLINSGDSSGFLNNDAYPMLNYGINDDGPSVSEVKDPRANAWDTAMALANQVNALVFGERYSRVSGPEVGQDLLAAELGQFYLKFHVMFDWQADHIDSDSDSHRTLYIEFFEDDAPEIELNGVPIALPAALAAEGATVADLLDYVTTLPWIRLATIDVNGKLILETIGHAESGSVRLIAQMAEYETFAGFGFDSSVVVDSVTVITGVPSSDTTTIYDNYEEYRQEGVAYTTLADSIVELELSSGQSSSGSGPDDSSAQSVILVTAERPETDDLIDLESVFISATAQNQITEIKFDDDAETRFRAQDDDGIDGQIRVDIAGHTVVAKMGDGKAETMQNLYQAIIDARDGIKDTDAFSATAATLPELVITLPAGALATSVIGGTYQDADTLLSLTLTWGEDSTASKAFTWGDLKAQAPLTVSELVTTVSEWLDDVADLKPFTASFEAGKLVIRADETAEVAASSMSISLNGVNFKKVIDAVSYNDLGSVQELGRPAVEGGDAIKLTAVAGVEQETELPAVNELSLHRLHPTTNEPLTFAIGQKIHAAAVIDGIYAGTVRISFTEATTPMQALELLLADSQWTAFGLDLTYEITDTALFPVHVATTANKGTDASILVRFQFTQSNDSIIVYNAQTSADYQDVTTYGSVDMVVAPSTVVVDLPEAYSAGSLLAPTAVNIVARVVTVGEAAGSWAELSYTPAAGATLAALMTAIETEFQGVSVSLSDAGDLVLTTEDSTTVIEVQTFEFSTISAEIIDRSQNVAIAAALGEVELQTDKIVLVGKDDDTDEILVDAEETLGYSMVDDENSTKQEIVSIFSDSKLDAFAVNSKVVVTLAGVTSEYSFRSDDNTALGSGDKSVFIVAKVLDLLKDAHANSTLVDADALSVTAATNTLTIQAAIFGREVLGDVTVLAYNSLGAEITGIAAVSTKVPGKLIWLDDEHADYWSDVSGLTINDQNSGDAQEARVESFIFESDNDEEYRLDSDETNEGEDPDPIDARDIDNPEDSGNPDDALYGENPGATAQTTVNPGDPANNTETAEFEDDLYGAAKGTYEDDGLKTDHSDTLDETSLGVYDRDVITLGDGSSEGDGGVEGENPDETDMDDDEDSDTGISTDQDGLAAMEGGMGYVFAQSDQNQPDRIYNFATGDGGDQIVLEAQLAASTLNGEVNHVLPESILIDVTPTYGNSVPGIGVFRAVLTEIDFNQPFNFVAPLSFRAGTYDFATQLHDYRWTAPEGTYANLADLQTALNANKLGAYAIRVELDPTPYSQTIEGVTTIYPQSILYIVDELGADGLAKEISTGGIGGELTGKLEVPGVFNLDSDEFGLVSAMLNAQSEQTVSAADLSNAAKTAALLNSLFDFDATADDDMLNTSVFAVTAADQPDQTAIWAHTQSAQDDGTVSADELTLLALVSSQASDFVPFALAPVGGWTAHNLTIAITDEHSPA